MYKSNFMKSTIVLVVGAIIFVTLSAPISYGVETAYFAKPTIKNDLKSLIGTFPKTLENERERADVNWLYQSPGEAVVSNPFKIDGVLQANISISSFQKFSLAPSKLFFTSGKTQELQNIGAYYANLPPCFSTDQTDCIFEFSLIHDDGKVLKAEPYAALPQVNDYPLVLDAYEVFSDNEKYGSFIGDKLLNLPSGGDLWVWNVPGLVSGKNSLYSASVSLSGRKDANLINPNSFLNPLTKLQISPVEVDLPICFPKIKNGCQWRTGAGLDGGIFESDEISIKRSANSFTGQYKLGFRLSVPWTSWLSSSVSGITIDAERQGSNYVYKVVGSPSLIPTVRKRIPVTESNKTALFGLVNGDPCSYEPTYCSPVVEFGKWVNSEAFKALETAERLSDAKATYMTKSWVIMSSAILTAPSPKDPKTELDICAAKYATDRPAGVTGSNATLFEHSPPTWDKNLRAFSYKVGAFKKTPEGKDFLGDYSLLVSSDVAGCLWGVEASSAKASLQVINSSGDAQVATTLVSRDSKWFRFRASGFHFSSPTIVAGIAKSVASKSTTIACVKGKLTKKVTAINPKCPVGYKKK